MSWKKRVKERAAAEKKPNYWPIILIVAVVAVLAFVFWPKPVPSDELIDNDPVFGTDDARVTIVEFSDFQCPVCRSAYFVLNEVKEKYGGRVRIAFKDFPLTSIHPHAHLAAEAAQCAFDQGEFWPYHDLLFENQHALERDSLKAYAAALGLDEEQFNQCLDSREMLETVQKDFREGERLGVDGTPTFFINGKKFGGLLTLEQFSRIIDAELG